MSDILKAVYKYTTLTLSNSVDQMKWNLQFSNSEQVLDSLNLCTMSFHKKNGSAYGSPNMSAP